MPAAPADAAEASPLDERVSWHAQSYLAGYRAALTEGYRTGIIDLERAKSEAASEGYRRGRDTSLSFTPPPREDRSGVLLLVCLFGVAVIARRVQRLEAHIDAEEAQADELPDVRS